VTAIEESPQRPSGITLGIQGSGIPGRDVRLNP
jgi:hypothetical protein